MYLEELGIITETESKNPSFIENGPYKKIASAYLYLHPATAPKNII